MLNCFQTNVSSTMVRQSISSPLFSGRAPLPNRLMSKLLVRGGGSQVDEALKKHRWNGSSASKTTVATIEIGTGRIRGVRYETRGSLRDVKFQAKDLWKDAEPGITVCLRFDNLGLLNWVGAGEARNQTTWIDGSNVNATFADRSRGFLSNDDEIRDAGIGGFSVQFTALPITVSQVALNAGIVPFTKEELDEKCKEIGLSLNSPRCPTLALKLHVAGAKSWNACPIDFFPREEAERVGWDHFPLVEVIGSGPVVMPDSDKLEEETTEFLRAVTGTNNVAFTRMSDMYNGEGELSANISGSVGYIWPEYRGPLATPQEPGWKFCPSFAIVT